MSPPASIRRRPTRAAGPVLAALLLAGCTSSAPATPDPADVAASPGADATAHGAPAADTTPPPLHPEVDGWDAAVVTLTPDDGPEAVVLARVAATQDQRQRGLMHVAEVPDGAGMLFTWDEERTGGFWMKDTLVPLDIAFVGADDVVRAVLTMTPCEEDPCPTYDAGVAYDRALEVPAGWFAANGIAEGARMTVTSG